MKRQTKKEKAMMIRMKNASPTMKRHIANARLMAKTSGKMGMTRAEIKVLKEKDMRKKKY